MVTFQVSEFDASRFNNAVNNIIGSSKKDMKTVVNQQGKLLATQFMHFTPPFADGKIPSAGEKGTTKADQKAGVEAVKRDILKTMTPPSVIFKDGYKNKTLERMIKRKENEKVQKFFKSLKGSVLNQWEVTPFDTKLHTDKRVSGRRFRPKSQKKFVNEENKIKQYIRKVQGRVGLMKAGWAKAIVFFGGKAPSWVAKLTGIAKGSASVLVDDGNIYKVEMSNSTPTTKRFTPNYQIAIRVRTNAMVRSYQDFLQKNLKKNLK